jgi:four helix bundle protein
MGVGSAEVTAVTQTVPSSQFPVLSKTEQFAGLPVTDVWTPQVSEFVLGGIMGRSYRDLIAWQKAMKLAIRIYAATQPFPKEERYGITNQLRRAAVSVPSNIAEGQARFSQKEFHHFLSQARGSLVEIETQLLIAKDLKYLAPANADGLLAAADELGRLLNGLIASIKSRAA